MSQKFFIIRGSLIECVKEDFFNADGYFLQDKLFFLKDYWTKNFAGYYRTPYQNLNIALKENEMEYRKNELDELLKFKLLYKLTSYYYDNAFEFQMFVKNALESDLFFNHQELIVNTCYYIIDDYGKFVGPNYIKDDDSPKKIREMIFNQKITVLSTKQLFEPYKIAKAS